MLGCDNDGKNGSPPRMRGKVFFFTGALFCAIFFLEPSGNLLLEPSGSSWVPPDGSIFVFAIGLPPRVRGKVVHVRTVRLQVGITPAYAGKSESCGLPTLPRWDHPCICGEKRKDRLDYYVPQGLPPRMRGKVQLQPGQPAALGITPAYAGKS